MSEVTIPQGLQDLVMELQRERDILRLENDRLRAKNAELQKEREVFVAKETADERLIDQLETRLAAVRWIRVTARDESLPPLDMKQVEMLLVTKTDGDFLAMTTGDQLQRLAASGNPKIANYYWRPFTPPQVEP